MYLLNFKTRFLIYTFLAAKDFQFIRFLNFIPGKKISPEIVDFQC